MVLQEAGWRFRFVHCRTLRQLARSSATSVGTEVTPEEDTTKRKVIKVAILGRPNAGKSTFINRILNKTICDVSSKTHTTRMPLKAAVNVGNTQIVFVDTPGVVTKQEYRKFDLSETFIEWKKDVFRNVDIVGVIHEARRVTETHNFGTKLINCLHELPETTPMFLMINKIDLVKDKDKLLKDSKLLLGRRKPKEESEGNDPEHPQDLEARVEPVKQNFIERFSKVFYISALKNIGVGDVVMYLLERAKEGEWVLPPDKPSDLPLHKIILNLVRAEFMDILPHALPYSLEFQIELLEENELGQIACVVLVKCQRASDRSYLLSRKFKRIKTIARKLESDFYNIFQKDFRLTLVVADKKGKT